jgi:DNA-binding transcriptional LysR family regulator
MEADNLDLGLLRTFLAVVENGSLGKTALAIDRTQPAISQQMLRLEKIVGQKLFARGRNGIKLTGHGQVLVTYAHRAVGLNEEMLLRLRGESCGRRVVVGMSADAALVGLGAALKRFQPLRSDLELRVTVTAANRLDALLEAGKLDWAIGDPSLMSATATEKWAVRLEWAAGNNFDFDESRPIPVALFEGAGSWQDEMLDSLRRAGRDWRVTFESASRDAVVAAVQSGLGIAALPVAAITDFALSRFEAIELPPPPMIEFGMFRSAAATDMPNGARSTFEARLAPMFDANTNNASADVGTLTV